MAKINRRGVRTATRSPIVSTPSTNGARTAEGGPAFERDSKSELFLLAATNLMEPTFYESADDRAERFTALIRHTAVTDPEWTAQMLRWLRTAANMRTASIVGAAEAARAMIDVGVPGARSLVRSVLQRADEPGEMLAYWLSTYGRSVPISVKRGIADAIVGHGTGRGPLYTQYSMLKYDTASHPMRFGDVIELVHPTGEHPRVKGTTLGDLFGYAIDRRHGRAGFIPESLEMIWRNADIRDSTHDPADVLHYPSILRGAGLTWEDALSLWGSKLDKAKLWEALIDADALGYMALLRNLRNFDEAGVSDTVAARVAAKLADPEQVQRSRQLPMRFLSAYRAAPSLRWSYPLEQALDASLSNLTTLTGSTLILVDTSGSMHAPFSKDGTLARWDAATVFGLAMARRCAASTVVSYSGSVWSMSVSEDFKVFPERCGESLLSAVDRWQRDGFFIGRGTDTAGAVRRFYDAHDRVVVLTDEQTSGLYAHGDVFASIPKTVPTYTWNLAGYQYGHAPSGSRMRYTFGGLTDAGLRMIPLLERGRDASWPWEDED